VGGWELWWRGGGGGCGRGERGLGFRRRSRLSGLCCRERCVGYGGHGRGGRRLAAVGGGIWLLARGLWYIKAALNGKEGTGEDRRNIPYRKRGRGWQRIWFLWKGSVGVGT